jgi:hypothetical protein
VPTPTTRSLSTQGTAAPGLFISTAGDDASSVFFMDETTETGDTLFYPTTTENESESVSVFKRRTHAPRTHAREFEFKMYVHVVE